MGSDVSDDNNDGCDVLDGCDGLDGCDVSVPDFVLGVFGKKELVIEECRPKGIFLKKERKEVFKRGILKKRLEKSGSLKS